LYKKYVLFIDWQEIRNIQLLNLQHGNNNIGISDIIIAQNCIQNELKIIAHDNHFKAMAKYIPLEI
jgi:predicted nucleic acid-binding protein